MKSKKPIGFWEAIKTEWFMGVIIGIALLPFIYADNFEKFALLFGFCLMLILGSFFGGWRPFARRDKR